MLVKLKFEPAEDARLDALQVLRAFAALLVVFSHILSLEHENWISSSTKYAPALLFGDFGVDAFFVISGFIICLTTRSEFGVGGASTRFLIKRLSRIAPPYWLFTLLALVCPFAFGAHHVSAAGVAASLAFLPDLSTPGFWPALVVGWSLSFEMLFYLVFASCLALPPRIGPRAVIWVLLAYVATAALLNRSSLAAQPWWPLARYWAYPQILLFIVGVVLAMARQQFGRIADRHGVATWLALGVLVLTPSLLFVLDATPHDALVMALAAGAVAVCAMASERKRTVLQPFVRLGDASYVLYLSHPFVIGLLSTAWLRMVGPRGSLLFDAVALGASCAAAWIAHLGLERPLLRASRRILGSAWGPTSARQGVVA